MQAESFTQCLAESLFHISCFIIIVSLIMITIKLLMDIDWREKSGNKERILGIVAKGQGIDVDW